MIDKTLVSKGLTPICGWQWVYAHLHDLDGWTSRIEISRPGSRYTITSKDTTTLNRAIKEITG